MKAKLIERGDRSDQTREIPLNQAEFLIGRGADCDLRLRVSSVSRHHCLIRLGAEEATLVDLGSSNGTYLNGSRVRSQATLHHGDEVQLGACRFLVELGEDDHLDLDTAVGAGPSTTTVKLPKSPLRSGSPKPSQPPSPRKTDQPET
jgi:pSer/pThr/pTyr-binding forkhead associated (FHA) protein